MLSRQHIVQENDYYPFGSTFRSVGSSSNRYFRENKERISDYDWNKHDYTGRYFSLDIDCRGLSIDPMAEMFYHLSPYSLYANNPMRNIDPTGEYWYSYQETYIDDNGDEQTRTQYAYHEQRLSKKEMKEKGYTNDLGLVHFSEDTYFRLEGGTTNLSDNNATISAMEEDFSKMSERDARNNRSKAESFLSGLAWNDKLPTTIGLRENVYVVSTSKNTYVNLTDKSLKRTFDEEYKKHLNDAQRHFYSSPVADGGRHFAGLMALFVKFAAPPFFQTPGLSEVFDSETIRYYNKLLIYYKKYNIIK